MGRPGLGRSLGLTKWLNVLPSACCLVVLKAHLVPSAAVMTSPGLRFSAGVKLWLFRQRRTVPSRLIAQ